MFRICFIAVLLISNSLWAQSGVGNLYLEFQQARVRKDYKEALELCEDILITDSDQLDKLIDQPDFFELKASQSSLLPLSPKAIRGLLKMQGFLYKAQENSLFWLKERGLTALYYQHELQDSLRGVLHAILQSQPEESSYLILDAFGESLLRDIRQNKIDPNLGSREFMFWDNLYRNLDMIHPEHRASAEDMHLLLVDALDKKLPSCEELEDEYRIRLARSLLRPAEYMYLYTALRIKGCKESSFRDTVLNRITPLVSSAYFLRLAADKHLQKESYGKAQKALEEALKLPQSNRIKAKNLLLMADIYAQRKSFRTARLIALQADQAYPEWGEPWLFQADLFLKSAPFCNFSQLERKALNWLAIDYCEKAMNLNDQLSVAARTRIALYQKSAPEIEELRFHGFQVGDSFPIPCWIGETTRIRY